MQSVVVNRVPVMKDAKSKDLSELFNTITVRNVPADVDEAITTG